MSLAVETLADPAALAARAAAWIAGLAGSAGERFVLCLSGGSTPERLFRLLADEAWRDRVPWARTHLFWGDERCVPHDHPDSNYAMARRSLIERVPVPPDQVHPVPTGPAPEAASRYAALLQRFYGAERIEPERPLFDAVLLGLGEDGHTASLFPGQPGVEERAAWAVPVVGVKAQDRVSLTLPVLGSARGVAFLVSGAGKREMLGALRRHDASIPAARVRTSGEFKVFADEAAAGGEAA